MRIRELPSGWYPDTETEILSLLDSWKPVKKVSDTDSRPVAGLVPHAGWTYCGSMIASVLTAFSDDIKTVIVLGGHNGPGGPLISYSESSWEFPSGIRNRDSDLVDRMNHKVRNNYDIYDEKVADNTVEVVMAMAASIFPHAEWVGWRVPADERAISFGEALAETIKDTGRDVAVVGSTDLTHYGPNFDFVPPESLTDPVGWVKARDFSYLDALLSFDSNKALQLAGNEHSACSSGGAVAAQAYAAAVGSTRGELIDYRSSRDIHPATSFVGYGSILWL